MNLKAALIRGKAGQRRQPIRVLEANLRSGVFASLPPKPGRNRQSMRLLISRLYFLYEARRQNISTPDKSMQAGMKRQRS
jgi:hypothetical protein